MKTKHVLLNGIVNKLHVTSNYQVVPVIMAYCVTVTLVAGTSAAFHQCLFLTVFVLNHYIFYRCFDSLLL